MALINRSELWLVELPEVGRHPSVVVSRQASIPVRTNVTMVLVTTTIRGGPAEVSLDTELGLDHPSVANCDEIYTIPKPALIRRLGELRVEDTARIDQALRVSLGLVT